MKRVDVADAVALTDFLSSFGGKDYLFRGQTGHYVRHDGSVSLPSSFARHGCIPTLMMKWTFFATELLRVSGTATDGVAAVPPEFVQALLQHYGWRSFFVDLTSSPAVASWFASHKFVMDHPIHISEDCFEEPVFLLNDAARYEAHVGAAHLYVLSKSRLNLAGHRLFDLSSLPSDFPSRPKVQGAWLAGPLAEPGASLHEGAVVAHVTAPAAAFREIASKAGFSDTLSIFPSQRDDYLLRHLLSLPWERIPGKDASAFPAYRRTLPLPDYEAECAKFIPATQAFVLPFWVAERRPPLLDNALFFRASEVDFYLRVGAEQRSFQPLLDFLKSNNRLVVECPRLLALPHQLHGTEYTKGVVLELGADGAVLVSELTVSHPGTLVEGVGLSIGYAYRQRGSKLERAPRGTDCPCNDSQRHDHHLDILAVCSEAIEEKRLIWIDSKNATLIDRKS